jgi:hypothetical protein
MRYENAVEARANSGDTAEHVVRHLMMPGHELARAAPLPGERIGEFLARTGWSKRARFADRKWRWTWQLPTVCMINGAFVLQRQWRRRRIKATDQVVFLSRPLGGDSGAGKQVLGLVALIAASALALWLPGVIGLSGIAGTLVTAGITVGASLLINALVAPKAGGQADAGTAQDTAPQAFSLSAAGNNPRPLQTIPVSYGRLRKHCDFATMPWSEFVGDEQYLNVLLCEGSGRYQHEQVLIDDTPLWTSGGGVNPDFDAQVAFYDPGQTVTLFPVNVTTAVEVNGQQLPPGTGSNPVNDLPLPHSAWNREWLHKRFARIERAATRLTRPSPVSMRLDHEGRDPAASRPRKALPYDRRRTARRDRRDSGDRPHPPPRPQVQSFISRRRRKFARLLARPTRSCVR